VQILLADPVSFETINKLMMFFECGIPRPQDVGLFPLET
jgi:hypothetical protein